MSNEVRSRCDNCGVTGASWDDAAGMRLCDPCSSEYEDYQEEERRAWGVADAETEADLRSAQR